MTGPAPDLSAPVTATPAASALASRVNEARLSPWTGEFLDAALETEFRESTRDEWARRVAVVALLVPLLILGFAYVDWKVLGPGPALWILWGERALLAVAGLGIARVLKGAPSVIALDRSAKALKAGIVVMVLSVACLHQKSVMFELPATLLAVLSFYLFIPCRFHCQVVAGTVLGGSFVAAHALLATSPAMALVSAATQMLTANALGAYTARRNHLMMRREFLALRQARRMASDESKRKDELQDSVAALERSNEELEQFAYVASHDLQAPLRNVISFAQLLQRRHASALGPQGAGYVDTIVQGASYMQHLITDLLALSRVGRSGTPQVPVDLGLILAQVEHQLASVVHEKQAQITHDPLPSVPGTPIELLQLLQNLVDNALKFQRPGVPPRIHVSARRAGMGWELSVRDNGIGIAAEHRDRIFRIFQRLNDTQAYKGTGIGLAICQKIVESHGGRIWVQSEPGRGSTFTFTLPSSYSQAFPAAV